MLVSISHVSRYAYNDTARYTVQSLRLTPPSFAGQKVLPECLHVIADRRHGAHACNKNARHL